MESLKDLLNSEQNLIFNTFNEQTAWDLGFHAVQLIKKKNLPVAIRIQRRDQILFQTAFKGTTIDNDFWMSGKIRVVEHFHHSSFYISRSFIESGTTMVKRHLDPDLYRDKGGAVPLFIKNGGICAVLAVSGLPDHEDHALSMEIVESFLQKQD